MWSQVYTFGLKGFGKLQWTFPWEISSKHGLELLGQNRIHSNLPGLEFSLALNQLQVEGQDSVGRDSYLISNLAKLFLFFRTMPQRSHIQIFSNTQKDFCNRLHGIFFPIIFEPVQPNEFAFYNSRVFRMMTRCRTMGENSLSTCTRRESLLSTEVKGKSFLQQQQEKKNTLCPVLHTSKKATDAGSPGESH